MSTNDAVFNLMAENGNLKKLLLEILPDMEARVDGLRKAWPGETITITLRCNEEHVRKIKEFTAGFELSGAIAELEAGIGENFKTIDAMLDDLNKD